MSISSVAASIAALRQQPAPVPLRSDTPGQSAPVQQGGRTHIHQGGHRAEVITASAPQTDTPGTLLDTVV